LLEDATAGDPISGLKWTRKTLRKLSQELKRRGFTVSPATVRRLLRAQDYTLRVNRKRLTKEADPHRDQQMRYIARQRRAFLQKGAPVISVDTKKKELVGPFRNAGCTWRQQPLEVLATDFPGDADGKAIPYGIYDLQHNTGYIVIGTSHETAAFAVAAIRTWWLRMGRRQYADHPHLLIEADGGGANSCRSWLWKTHLQALADELQLTITVTHFPPGTSKWNPIEHRLFSAITHNWAGQPLVSYETILKFIRTTSTDTGLQCRACLHRRDYPTGRKVPPQEKAQVNLVPSRIFPHWNYTLKPHNAGRE